MAARNLVIYRGANALEYGASTLGGAIEMTSPTAYSTPSSIMLRAGSHQSYQAQATASYIFNDYVDALLTVDASTYGGYREHSEQDTLRLYSNVGFQLHEDITTRFYVTALNLDMEIPGSLSADQVEADRDQANPNAITGDYQRNLDVYRIANKTTWTLSEGQRLDLGFSYENQELFHPIVAQSMFFGGLHVQRDRDDINGMLRYAQQGGHDYVLGINGGIARVEGTNSDNEAGFPGDTNNEFDNTATNIELYALDRWSLHADWTVILGLQLSTGRREVQDTTLSSGLTETLSDTYTGVNPRVGLVYHMNDDMEIYGHVSRLFEPPTLSQLEDEGAGETLEAMSGLTVEAGTRGDIMSESGSDFSWNINAYYSWIRDEILSLENPNRPGTSIAENADKTIHAGIEAALSGSFELSESQRIEPVIAATWNYFRFDGDVNHGNNKLPGVPDAVLRMEALYRHRAGWFVGPTLDVSSGRYADDENTYKIDSYALVGLRGGLTQGRWSAFVEVRNLFDTDYIASSSLRDKAAEDAAILNPGEPLSVYAGIKATF